jgi:CRP-like cAMP-binding protein
MKNVGSQCSFLKASPDLRSALQQAGRRASFAPGQVLFREDQENLGVYLVLKGKVRMSVQRLPKLDRLFSAGSLIGLPSTFTERPYSLTAQAITEADAIQVTAAPFLTLMRERPELCREATEMLGREVTFIQGALAERRKQGSSRKALTEDVASEA